jgi:hypothetical protein
MGQKLSDRHPGVVVGAVFVAFLVWLYFDSVRTWTSCVQGHIAEMGISGAEEWCSEVWGRPLFF